MELLVLNEKFETIGVMDTYESIIWTDRYSEYGDFEIYTTPSLSLINMLKMDQYLYNSDSEHVMIIEDHKIETDTEFGNHLTVTGRSLESLLDRRIVWSTITLDGYLEGQIEKLLNENVIQPKDEKRKIPNFVFVKSGDERIEKLKINAQYTGDNIYDLIKKLCEIMDLGFKITMDEQNRFLFQFYMGEDRSYNQEKNAYVVFSPNFENIISSDYYESKRDYRNITLVAGEGENVNRRTLIVGNQNVSGIKRRELYSDARDISSTTSGSSFTDAQYNKLLQTRGEEKLSDYKIKKTFEGQMETTQLYRYKEHFFMGDIVQLENEFGMNSRVRIIEYIKSENKNGIESYPTFEVLESEEEE